MPGNSLLYSDIDPNVIELIYRRFQTPLEKLIDDKLQRRQLWGPTFKQEGIYNAKFGAAEGEIPDADWRIPEPENQKRTFVFTGTLSATRTIRVPPIKTAWWYVYNKTDQPLSFLIDPAGTVGPTVAAGAVAAIITDGVEIWSLASGAGTGTGTGVPGGTATQLQYKIDATTFGGVAGSSVSGANVGLAGVLTNTVGTKSIVMDPVTQPFSYTRYDRGGADLVHADYTGAIVFSGRRAGAAINTGAIGSYWSDTDGAGATLEMGSTTRQARVVVAENSSPAGSSATMLAGSQFIQVLPGGLRISGGGIGSIFYQDSTMSYVPLDIVSPTDLGKVLTVTDVGGGVLQPRWQVGGGTGAVPGVPLNSLQWNNAGSFGGMSASQVTGANLRLGGLLTLNQNGTADNSRVTTGATGPTAFQVFEKYHDTDADPMLIDFRRARGSSGSPGAIGDLDWIGKLRFTGWDTGLGDFRQYGYLNAQYTSAFAGVVRLGAGADGGARIEISDMPASTTIWANPTWLQVNAAGIRTPFTTAGLLLYTDINGYINGIAPTTNGHVLTLVSGAPQWAPPSGTGVNDRLDQILNPLAAKAFTMGPYNLGFSYTPTADQNCFVIESTADTPYAGTVFWARTTGTMSQMAAMRVSADLNHELMVTQTGVGIGTPNTVDPQARFHVVGTTRFDLGSDAPGDMYVRGPDPNGFLTRIPASTTNGYALTWVAGSPQWAAIAASGALPDGDGSELQARLSPTAFKRVTGSSVSGPNIALGGNQSFISLNTNHTLAFDRLGAALVSGNVVGQILFYTASDPVGGSYGFIRALEESASGGRVIDIGMTANSRLVVSASAITMLSEGHYFQAQTNGLRISGGARGSLYYQDYYLATPPNLFFTPLAIGGNGTFLKSDGTLPLWASISMTDVSGVLPLNKGGTGQNLSDPGGEKILYWNNTTNAVTWLNLGANLSIDAGTNTISAAGSTGGAPGLPDLGIQYRINGTTFGGITASTTDGTNVRFGGTFKINKAGVDDSQVFTDATSANPSTTFYKYTTDSGTSVIGFRRARGTSGSPGAVGAADIMGRLHFQGLLTAPSTWRDYGWIDVIANGSGHPVMQVGAGPISPKDPRLEIVYQYTDGNSAATLWAGSHYLMVNAASGIVTSIGTTGSMFYKTAGSELAAVPGFTEGYMIKIVSGIPTWVVAPSGSGANPATPVNTLQYCASSTTFGALANSAVNTTTGALTLEERSNTQGASTLILQKALATGGNVTDGYSAGKIAFNGYLSGTPQAFGILEGLYNTSPSTLRTLRLGQGTLAAGNAYRVIALKDNGTINLEVSNASVTATVNITSSGLTWSGGDFPASNARIVYRNGSGILTTLANAGTTGQFLYTPLTGFEPSWTTLAAADIGSGTYPAGRHTYTPTTTVAGLNVGAVSIAGSDPSSASPGDVYYNSNTGKLRGREASAWGDLISTGSGGLTLAGSSGNLQYNNGASNLAALATTISGSDITFPARIITTAYSTSTATNGALEVAKTLTSTASSDKGAYVKLTLNYTGTSTGTRNAMVIHYYQGGSARNTNTSGIGDCGLQIYLENLLGITASDHVQTGINIETSFAAGISKYTALRIQAPNATTRIAIQVDTNAGSVVVGAGGTLGSGATQGFLYLPSSSVSQSSTPVSMSGPVPVYIDTTTSTYVLKAWNGSTWQTL